ncbi:OmpA family protein [Flexivirga meconopsidis]|uniref:OmpA family protein n=1 Tax=Flexivirga meconopsidis TaxID=2977121 RepID=UPI002240BAC8|nr:OmpA family protein [Flexivirga meconopsidis]
MKRTRTTSAAIAVVAAATLLTACNQEQEAASVTTGGPAGSSAPAAAKSAASASGSGSQSSRPGPEKNGALTDAGGWYAEGNTVTFVYNNGVRYSFDAGGTIGDIRNTKLRTDKGTLTLSASRATWVSADGKPSSVDVRGAGVVADGSGVIAVLPDGSVTCANKAGLQFVGSDGRKAAATKSGAFYLDEYGKKTVVGTAPKGGKLAGRFVVCSVGNTSTIDLFADVLFDFGSSTLTPAGKQVVDQTAATIQSRVASKTVSVVGNTDSVGTPDFNKQLGQRRADAVAAELRGKLPGIQLKVSSNGETQPVAANTKADGSDNPSGRAKNRRVTISFAN